MKQHISIILRNQFNLFYRFGYTFIPDTFLIEFDGTISDKVKERVAEMFCRITPFEYDEEYLILHIKQETNSNLFNIQDIIAIYPLSQQAKISIESKIDERIKLENPIFETVMPDVERDIINKEREKAIDALWYLCGFDGNKEDYLKNIGEDNIINGLEHRAIGKKAKDISAGNYWEYLLAYDRYDYFPKSTLGYFYDAGQVLAYSTGRTTFEGSDLHGFLENLNRENPEIQMGEILKSFDNNEALKRYISQTTISDVKQYIIAPLYLLLRDDIRNADDIKQTKLFKNKDWLMKEFSDNFKYAVILLGSFFGFRKFYDVYYDQLNLRFYKNYQPPEVINNDDSQKNLIKQQEINSPNLSDISKYVLEQLNITNEISLTDINKYFKLNTNKEVKSKLEEISDKIEIGKNGKKEVVRFKTPELNLL